MNMEDMLVAIIEFNTDPKELLYDFADFISDYFDDPELYCKPDELIRMYKEYKDREHY